MYLLTTPNQRVNPLCDTGQRGGGSSSWSCYGTSAATPSSSLFCPLWRDVIGQTCGMKSAGITLRSTESSSLPSNRRVKACTAEMPCFRQVERCGSNRTTSSGVH